MKTIMPADLNEAAIEILQPFSNGPIHVVEVAKMSKIADFVAKVNFNDMRTDPDAPSFFRAR